MTDPLTGAFVILTLVQVVRDINSLVQRVQDSDTKFDTLRWRMQAQKMLTDNWMAHIRQMQLTRSDSIQIENEADMREICQKLVQYHTQAKDRLSKYRAGLPNRVSFVLGGYERLKDIIDAIVALNEALEATVRFPPPYSAQADSRRRIQRGDVTRRHPEQESVGQMEHDAPREERPSRQLAIDETAAPTPSIESAYRIAHRALIMIGRDVKYFTDIASRLKLWGIGLFQERVSVDIVLPCLKGDAPIHFLQLGVLESFAYILVLAERELQHLSQQKAEDRQPEMNALRNEIASVLSTKRLMATTLLVWTSYAPAEPDSLTTSADNLAWSRTSSERPQREGTSNKSAVDMASFVESLFSVLPALASEQRTYCATILASQDAKSNSAAIQDKRIDVTSKPDDIRQSVQHRMQEIERIVDEHDKRESGLQWRPSWKKIREDLEPQTRVDASMDTSKAATTVAKPKEQSWAARMVLVGNILEKWVKHYREAESKFNDRYSREALDRMHSRALLDRTASSRTASNRTAWSGSTVVGKADSVPELDLKTKGMVLDSRSEPSERRADVMDALGEDLRHAGV